MERNKKVLKRLDYMDIAKGIGIIAVVWAHSNGPLSDYMYQFHMPLFFLTFRLFI